MTICYHNITASKRNIFILEKIIQYVYLSWNYMENLVRKIEERIEKKKVGEHQE